MDSHLRNTRVAYMITALIFHAIISFGCRTRDLILVQYGGDITRKLKLLRKQKEGKKKLRRIGSVELSKEAFLSVHSKDNNECCYCV